MQILLLPGGVGIKPPGIPIGGGGPRPIPIPGGGPNDDGISAGMLLMCACGMSLIHSWYNIACSKRTKAHMAQITQANTRKHAQCH